MGYKDFIGRPRFYVNIPQFLHSVGLRLIGTEQEQLDAEEETTYYPNNPDFKYDPAIHTGGLMNFNTIPSNYRKGPQAFNINDSPSFMKLMENNHNFLMLLGHKLGGSIIVPYWFESPTVDEDNPLHTHNMELFNDQLYIAQHGWTLMTGRFIFESIQTIDINTSMDDRYLGSVVHGTFWDMPKSCDLRMTLTYEMDGIDKTRTPGGHDLVQRNYIKPENWGELGAWELTEPFDPSIRSNQSNPSKSGREICDLCLYDYSGAGASCCDQAWVLYGITCEDLAANYGWDCSGCNCPGDTGGEYGEVIGCMDTAAYNYDPWANVDCGDCCEYEGTQPSYFGCTDSSAYNYDPGATVDDGTCIYNTYEDINILPIENASRIGRKIWHIQFSYMSESELYPPIVALSNLGTDSEDLDNLIYNTVFQSNETNEAGIIKGDFFSQVVLRTAGMKLPFIFSPSSGGTNVLGTQSHDNYAICKFDQSGFKIKQVADSVYQINLVIKEVW